MIYRGPGFLAVVWFCPLPRPLSRQQVVSLLSLPVCRRSSLPTGEEGEGVEEEPSHATARNSGPLKIILLFGTNVHKKSKFCI